MDRSPLRLIVHRAVRWRCPNCGRGRLFRGVFLMYSKCAECGLSYYPEQGYYLGAMIINYIVTTALILGLFLLSLLFKDFTSLTTNEKIILWIAFAIVLSLALMRHAYSFWLGLDFWVTPRKPGPPVAENS